MLLFLVELVDNWKWRQRWFVVEHVY